MKFLILFFAFISASSAVVVNCTFSNYTVWTMGTMYGCGVDQITIDGSILLLKATGDHVTGFNNKDVRHFLAVAQENLDFVIQGIAKNFPNIIGLDFSWNKITTLKENEFDEYENLEFLNLTGNKIAHIPGNLFKNLPRLRVALFLKTEIQTVGLEFPESLRNLGVADFNANGCIGYFASTPGSMDLLISIMKNNCGIDENIENTQIATIEEVTCDLNETICEIKKQNQILLKQNVEINLKLDELKKFLLKEFI